MSTSTSGHLSVHMGANARVECLTYTDTGPILCVSTPGLHLTVNTREREAVKSFDLDNARALVEATKTFLAECERLHALHSGQDDIGSERAA
jgi:hypothetical protein